MFSVLFSRLAGLSVKLKEDGKSFVWSSSGNLIHATGKRINCDQIYCKHCFDDGKGKLKSYKETVSTTNMAQHLRDAHCILFIKQTLIICSLKLVGSHNYIVCM